MSDREEKRDLLILGVHQKSEAYPNVLYRIRDLEKHPDINTHEINFPIMDDPARTPGKLKRRFPRFLRTIYGHIYILIRYLFSPYKQTVYVPYPATFVCWTLSLLPKRLQPSRLIIDQFISLYETIVIDRRLISRNGLLAKLLFRIERRALHSCDSIIVDTSLNRIYIENLFNIPLTRIDAIPLTTNEEAFSPREYNAGNNRCRVLFIGTLIPLHGIQIIISAIKLLQSNNHIEFTIIGDGQDAKYLEAFNRTGPKNLVWLRKWTSPYQLADEIDKSDICLGIFSGSKKADRVCPLKLYAYMSIGRPVITADTNWSRNVLSGHSKNEFCTIAPGSGELLAKQIESLALAHNERQFLSTACQGFYRDNLSNKKAIDKLSAIILG